MTVSILLLSTIAATFLFFTASRTEQSRIVAIHRPLVITQERKSPAYYLYQQVQKLQQSQPEKMPPPQPSTHLSRLSLQPAQAQVATNEMTITRQEVIAYFENSNPGSLVALQRRGLASEISAIPELSFDGLKSVAALNSWGASPLSTVVAPTQAETTNLEAEKKWATIKGKFELKDGVAIIDHHIVLRRVEEGQTKEVGRIDINTGTYSIDIASPNGYLIAQIKDKSGLLVGEDRQRLINLQSKGVYFEGPYIRVGSPPSLAANTGGSSAVRSPTVAANSAVKSQKTDASANSTSSFSVSLFDQQNILKSHTEKVNNVSLYSSTISRVYDASGVYKNITTVRHTGDASVTEMWTEKWLLGALGFINDSRRFESFAESAPVIVGRLLQDGKALAGAQVRIESAAGFEPIYLDQFMIPNLVMSSTGENGYFMFVGLSPGAYNVVAVKNNLNVGTQLFIAEENAIAFQNIMGLSIPISKVARAFDAFTGEPVASDVFTSEYEEAIEMPEGYSYFQSRTELGLSEYVVRPADRSYIPMRYIQNARMEYAHLPLIREQWLEQLKAAKKINEMPDHGTIIGFTRELNYDAYLTVENYDSNQIVYFTSQGELSETAVAGGGFILFNVPAGAREVILQEKQTEKIYSQVFSVLSAQISTTHFVDE